MTALLICVGGTGQHVARAVARLTYIRALAGPVDCRIIDGDDAGTLADGVKTFGGFTDGSGFRSPPLRGADPFLKPFDAEAVAASGRTMNFRSLMVGGNEAAGSVFDLLFTPESASVDVLRGFYANPSIGASAFAAQRDDIVSGLRAQARSAQAVVIVGSFIGGTGAGVIPSLVEQIASDDKYYGIFHLNWLSSSIGDAGAISTESLDANMRHGLDYFYRQVRRKLKASVLLGPPPVSAGAMASRCHPKQAETPSFFHVLAAFGYFSLVTNAVARYKNTVLTWVHDTGRPLALLDEKWEGGRPLRDRLIAAVRAKQALAYYVDSRPNCSKLKDSYGLFGSFAGVPAGLQGAKKFAALREQAVAEFIEELVDELRIHHVALTDATSYFREVFGEAAVEAQVGDPLDVLKRAWFERIDPDPTAGGRRDRLVADLAGQLVAALLK